MIDIQSLQDRCAHIAEVHNFDLVVLFGSQATGRTHSHSDVDIAIVADTKIDMYKVTDEFQKICGRQDVEVVNIGDASPTLMYCVVRDGKILFEKNKGGFMKWKFFAIKTWLDSSWLRTLGDKRLVAWAQSI
jgi:predicted nucleotidyltransferase